MQTNPSTPFPTPRIYSRREAATYLKMTPGTLANLHLRGEGPVHYRRGKITYYLESDLVDWITGGRRSK